MEWIAWIAIVVLITAVPYGYRTWRKRMDLKTFEPLPAGSRPLVDIELENGYPHTLEEVGNIEGVTRERVRQIEAKALRKLRHPTRARQLRGFLD